MIPKYLLLLPLLALPFTPALAGAWNATEPVVQDEDTPLQEAMGVFKHGQRNLKKLIGDPAANEAALIETLESLESAALVAIGETPPAPEGLETKPLALFYVGFRQQLANVLSTVLGMQAAVLNADAAALAKGYDTLNLTKKAGHQSYRDF